jgi:hypothetical protein
MRPALVLRVAGKPADAQRAMESAAKPEPAKRCRARHGSARCELPAGHVGPHNSHWGDF